MRMSGGLANGPLFPHRYLQRTKRNERPASGKTQGGLLASTPQVVLPYQGKSRSILPLANMLLIYMVGRRGGLGEWSVSCLSLAAINGTTYAASHLAIQLACATANPSSP